MTWWLSRLSNPFGLVAGSGRQETETKVSTLKTPDTTAYTTGPSPVGEVQDQRTHEPNTIGTRKRSRPGEMVESERKRMRSDRSSQGSHLFANYGSQREAQSIAVPQNSDNEERECLSTVKMPDKFRGRGFKPTNTLNDTRYSSSMGHRPGRNSTRKEETVIWKLPPPTLDTLGIRGLNVRTPTSYIADGFTHYDTRTKRQKLSNGHANSVLSAQQIDLTEDDSQPNPLSKARGRVVKDNTTSTTMLQPSLALDDTIASRSDQYTRTGIEKKKRKKRNSQGSSQTSARTTPSGLANTLSTDKRAVRESPANVMPIYDQDEEVVVDSQVTQAKRPDPEFAAEISNDGRFQERRKSTRSGNDEAKAVGKLLNSTAQRRTRADSVNRPATRSNEKATGNKLVPQIPRRPHQEEDSPLRKQFVRDTEDPPPARMRATQRMQTISDVSGRISLGSEDELSGARTVPSPAKSIAPPMDEPRGIREAKTRREVMPSDLQPTKFYGTWKAAVKTQSRKKQDVEVDEEVRIPITSISCRSCCLQHGQLELLWDDTLSGFLVEAEGERQRIPNKDQLVSFGVAEAHHWFAAQSKAFLAVHIKGPVTSNSNGSIIIEFDDFEGLSDCRNALLDATRDSLRTKLEPDDRMQSIVFNKRKTILADHEKESRPKYPPPMLKDHNAVDLAAMQGRKKRREIPQLEDEESIRYEDNGSEDRQPRRSRMRADGSNVVETSGTRSQFFTFQPERRSSRQVKPVKEKSPSPPPPVRWTSQNKLRRWSHSVIYPPEGTARRVTVDFQDLERLDDGEFLNDNIIGFALRRIEENMAPELKDKVLYFNTFFYTALTTKNGKKQFNYEAVKRWTKNKDLFNFPYVVVPINIDLHWFVAIICNLPNLSRKPAAPDDEPEDESEMLLDAVLGEDTEHNEIVEGLEIAESDEATRNAQNSMHHLSISDNETKSPSDKAGIQNAADDVEAPSSSRPSNANGKKSNKTPPRQRKFSPDTPSIITLDSFGSAHPVSVRFLKDYLNMEADAKRGMEVTKDDLQGVTAKGIPEQTNFCDCGVYLVGYIEEFAKDPRKFVTQVLQKNLDQQDGFAAFDPSAKRAEIRDELLKLHEEQQVERKGQKKTKKTASAVNGEALKVAQPSSPTKAQNSIKIPIVDTKDPTAFVPLLPPSEHLAESAKPGHGVTQSATLDIGDEDAEDNDLETIVPRAFERFGLPLSGEGEIPPSSSRVVEDREDDVWDGFSDAHSGPNLAPSNLAPVYIGKDLLDGIEEYASEGPGSIQYLPTSSIVSLLGSPGQLITNVDRETAGKVRHGDRRDDNIDYDPEHQDDLEVQDSQERKH